MSLYISKTEKSRLFYKHISVLEIHIVFHFRNI
nr:MAG TPA: hypothetical protein [Caudoviricetes sp.]